MDSVQVSSLLLWAIDFHRILETYFLTVNKNIMELIDKLEPIAIVFDVRVLDT